MSIGQFMSSGAAAAFKMSRMFKGKNMKILLVQLDCIDHAMSFSIIRSRMGNGDQFISCIHLLQCYYRLVSILLFCFVSSLPSMGSMWELVEHRSLCQSRYFDYFLFSQIFHKTKYFSLSESITWEQY